MTLRRPMGLYCDRVELLHSWKQGMNLTPSTDLGITTALMIGKNLRKDNINFEHLPHQFSYYTQRNSYILHKNAPKYTRNDTKALFKRELFKLIRRKNFWERDTFWESIRGYKQRTVSGSDEKSPVQSISQNQYFNI